jgi:hypothetical protein
MSYRAMYAAAVAVAVIAAILAAMQLANPAELGISPIVVAWIKIITPGLTILASVLPSVRQPPRDEREGLD